MAALLHCLGATLAMLVLPPAGAQSQSAPTPIPPHIAQMVLSTPKPVSEGQMTEFKQDFVDVDFNYDNVMDAQEVRAHFTGKGGISNLELYQFFLDSDKDMSGTISLQEYVDYAAMLN
mmetsp:Transcript_104989/g.208723  ORF Transcript_104989/g.208723 Transcript_104989/m.208723 type:complete len:118 (+) Transcript_104989:71-424(+)